MIMLMATFGQAAVGLCDRACRTETVHVGQTVLAVGRQWVAN
jgi:hypothetical protein